VGTVLATDGDAGTSFSAWTETGGTGASIFEINASSGAITVTDNSGIDYETTTSYTYTVTVSDGINTSASETITINITDVNDVTPVVTASQSFSIAENTANSGAVGTVLATDGDAGTSFSAWTETGGTGASIFEINASSGAITVTDNSGIDYETTTSYTYTVTVSDGINTSASETITINITDVNDVAPVVTASQSFGIAENIANSGAVGTVLATDGDAGTSFSAWTETGGTGASIFEINASSGAITVTDNSGIDYETTTSYTYTVTVSDGTNTSAAETIAINITDVNDVAPVVTASQSFSIAENIANSGAVGTVLATDGDAGTSFSAWTETGGTGASIFEINASSGAITVTDNSGIDYETTTSYTYTVTVSDGINTST
ncbi:cadherin domain-containing protein, partial [Labilibaculum euxinus]